VEPGLKGLHRDSFGPGDEVCGLGRLDEQAGGKRSGCHESHRAPFRQLPDGEASAATTCSLLGPGRGLPHGSPHCPRGARVTRRGTAFRFDDVRGSIHRYSEVEVFVAPHETLYATKRDTIPLQGQGRCAEAAGEVRPEGLTRYSGNSTASPMPVRRRIATARRSRLRATAAASPSIDPRVISPLTIAMVGAAAPADAKAAER